MIHQRCEARLGIGQFSSFGEPLPSQGSSQSGATASSAWAASGNFFAR